jgi:hypothetical protein
VYNTQGVSPSGGLMQDEMREGKMFNVIQQ